MIYKPEHIVDLETGAIIDVELKPGDEADAKDLAERVQDAEEGLNKAVGAPRGTARVETVVGDLGYCNPEALATLQAAGIRTVIPDPVRDRHVETLPPDQRQALRAAAQALTSASGQWLMRHRGEFCERSFMHVLEYGGARRTTLRGRENILKRYLVQAACLNLSILLRHAGGPGTLKQTWAASARAIEAAIAWLRALLQALEAPIWSRAGRRSRRDPHFLVCVVSPLQLNSEKLKLSSSTVS
jgi:hypothetical protein